MPSLCEFYPGICLTTEEKARKNLSLGSRRVLVYILHITKTHTLQNLHTHTHTHTHIHTHKHTRTHYKTHTYMHTHTHTRTLQNNIKLLPGFIFISFSTAHSPNLFRSFCNFSMSLLSVIFLYIIQSSANSRMLDHCFSKYH